MCSMIKICFIKRCTDVQVYYVYVCTSFHCLYHKNDINIIIITAVIHNQGHHSALEQQRDRQREEKRERERKNTQMCTNIHNEFMDSKISSVN